MNDAQLEARLADWKVKTPLPPRFQEQVWHRIARAEAPAARSFWSRSAEWLESALPRPKVALSYVAALLIIGVAAGSLAAQVKSSHLNNALGARYVQAIDPYRPEAPLP